MNKNEYPIEVTRTEIRRVSDFELDKEREFQLGKAHRRAGLPCSSANGAYLNGWYNPEKDFYYIDKEAAHLL